MSSKPFELEVGYNPVTLQRWFRADMNEGDIRQFLDQGPLFEAIRDRVADKIADQIIKQVGPAIDAALMQGITPPPADTQPQKD